MYKKPLFLICILACLYPGLKLFSQTNSDSSHISISADIVSRYVWRGILLGGNTPAIQPELMFNIEKQKHNISVSSWASYSIGGINIQEVDLVLSYTYNNLLTITITDYFFPNENGKSPRYFDFRDRKTEHIIEGALGFEGTESFPFTLLFAMNIYGNDARKFHNDGRDAGIVNSKYIEFAYLTSFRSTNLELFAGAALDAPDKNSKKTFYENKKAGLINLGLKTTNEIKISNSYSVPLFCQFIVNPDAQNVFLVFGMTI